MGSGDVRIRVLGPLELEREGRVLPVPPGHQRVLLALLAHAAGAPLSRDRLIDELWGERPPASAVSALHVHISKLRKLLGPALLSGPGGYALAPGCDVDARRLEELLAIARAEPGRSVPVLGEALALFRGDPLCDVAHGETVDVWRRVLAEQRLQATIARIDAELDAGAAGGLVAELEVLVGEHPYEEHLWSQLILALYRAGRQADALEAFQRARARADELGLRPGAALGALQRQILDHDKALQAQPKPSDGTDQPRVAGAAVARLSSALPRPATRLIGRENDLDALDALLADPEVRIVTLSGAGGVGKTRLAIELARRHEQRYAHGAAFVRLDRLTDPELVMAEIATEFARRDEQTGLGADGLTRYLRDRELLLVLDNLEHLLSAATAVAELVERAPGLTLLATSRIPLRIRGEHGYQLQPLALPTGDSHEEAAFSPAVQLFVESALAVDRTLDVDEAMTIATARICRALDGLPLGIELAASRVRTITPTEIAAGLGGPLSIGGGLRDLPDRQRTLTATLAWSYDLLSPEARNVLCAAGVFLGGFTSAGLAEVSGTDVYDALEELRDASLVRRQGDGERFELLELVRAFAAAEAERMAIADELRARHRRHFRAIAGPAGDAFESGSTVAGLPLLPDHANLRAALEDAIAAGDQDSAIDLALGLRPVWQAASSTQESQELLERLLERFAVPAGAAIRLMRSVAVVDYGPAGTAWYRRAAELARETGDAQNLVRITVNLASRAINARDELELERLRPQLQAMAAEEPPGRTLCFMHYMLAIDATARDCHDEALLHAEVSAEQARIAGDEYLLAAAESTTLMAATARDGAMSHAGLSRVFELLRVPAVLPMSTLALWFVALYASAVDREAAVTCLVHAERIMRTVESELWPECRLRDDAMAALGIDDLSPLMNGVPELDPRAALDAAAVWLAGRDPAEIVLTRSSRRSALRPRPTV